MRFVVGELEIGVKVDCGTALGETTGKKSLFSVISRTVWEKKRTLELGCCETTRR